LYYSRLGQSSRNALVGFFWVLYFITFTISYPKLGSIVTALSLLPVSGTAWVFGTRWGLAASTASIPLNLFLNFIASGGSSLPDPLSFIIGTIIIYAASIIIGRMSDLGNRLHEAFQFRTDAEKQLRKKSVELQQQKLYYEALVQNSPIAIVSLTPDQKIKSCNPSFEKLFGYKQEEITGQYLDPLISGHDNLNEAEVISKIVHAGTPVQAAGKRRTKNGKIIDVDIYGVPVIINGKQEGILGQYVDVTEKRLAETALQEHVQFLQAIIDVIPTPVSYKSIGGLYIGCNEAFEASVGIPRDEIIGRSVYEIYPKKSADQIVHLDKKLLERPGIQRIETRLNYTDDSLRDILLNRATFNDIHGNLAGVISAYLDITDIKQTERDLRKSEERFRSIFEYAPDAVIILDTKGTILSWNPAAEKIFGYSEADIIGENAERFMPTNKREDYQSMLMRLDHPGMPDPFGETIESEGKCKDGTTIPLEVSLSIWQSEDEQFISVIVRDITDRKNAEKVLREAKTTAEEVAKVKAQFLAHMSHEIRTPLNAIIGMTGLLLDTPLSTDQKDHIETIRLSGDSLLEIINSILDFSRIEAGKVHLENKPFNLRSCVESALDLVIPSAIEKGINLAYIFEDSTPNQIIGPQTHLRQVLVNLLANAVKFTDEGEVVVAVCPHKLSEDQYQLHFSVRDTGIGISPEDIELLFQSFSQVDSSSKRRYSGTGLGLAISKNLVESMGGEIHVESEKGGGSIFSFWIVIETTPETSPLFPAGDQPELQKKRVLILDENLTNLRILAQHTQSWGMEPYAFQSAGEVLRKLKEMDHFDIAIIDNKISNDPQMNLVEVMRNFHRPEVLPILLLRKLGSRPVKELEAEHLYDGFLTKPIKPAILFDILMKVFKKRPTPIQEIAKTKKIDSQLGQKHPLKILLAEDNPINQKVAVKILEQMGYRPDIASNGFDVVHALERQFYDLILLDIQMPEMDGEQAARIIRNNYLHARQPRIVALTAHALEGDREKYLAAGMDDFISKPVRIEEIQRVLEETPLLHRRPVSDKKLREQSET
jgi:PAS domain S-box-containing protein